MQTISLWKRAVAAASALGSLLLAAPPVHAQGASPCVNSNTFGNVAMLALSRSHIVYMILPDGSTARRLAVSGVNGTLIGIDRRPSDGVLYGLSSTRELYTLTMTPTQLIGTRIGMLMFPPPPAPPVFFSTDLMMDFNPTNAGAGNALRIIDRNDNNIAVVSQNGGNLNATAVQTRVAYVAGDPAAGANPSIVSGAYDSNMNATPTTTFFMIDSDRNTLVTINDRNMGGSSNTTGGALRTIGGLFDINGVAIDFDTRSGMDIFTTPSAGQNFGVAITNRDLYCIDLQLVNPNLPAGTTAPVTANKLILASNSLARASSDAFLDVALVPLQPADIQVTVFDTPDPVSSGETLTYRVLIKNNGPFDAANLSMVTGQLVITNVTATPSQGSCVSPQLCGLGSVNAGASATVMIRGQVPPLQSGSTFQGGFIAGASNPDPNPLSNFFTATTTVR